MTAPRPQPAERPQQRKRRRRARSGEGDGGLWSALGRTVSSWLNARVINQFDTDSEEGKLIAELLKHEQVQDLDLHGADWGGGQAAEAPPGEVRVGPQVSDQAAADPLDGFVADSGPQRHSSPYVGATCLSAMVFLFLCFQGSPLQSRHKADATKALAAVLAIAAAAMVPGRDGWNAALLLLAGCSTAVVLAPSRRPRTAKSPKQRGRSAGNDSSPCETTRSD